jgi:hypothetical protein
MSEEDKIKGAASFVLGQTIQVEEIECEKENLLDYMWLFSNIPWTNHDSKVGKVSFDEPTEVHLIVMDGYDTSTTEIQRIEFDNVIIDSIHGFAGNSFTFEFKLGDERVGVAREYNRFGFTKEEAKERFIKSLEQKLKGLTNQINRTKDNIEKIRGL